MGKTKIWIGICLIFFAGTCIGAIGSGLIIRHKLFAILSEGQPAVFRLVSKRLTRKLDLTPEQQVKVNATIQETQQRLAALRNRYQPETRIILGEGLAAIHKELSPPQQEKLNTLRQKMRSRFPAYQGFQP